MLTHTTQPRPSATLGSLRADLRASVLFEALKDAQAALAMMVEPVAIEKTSILQAWSVARAAEAKARKALALIEETRP